MWAGDCAANKETVASPGGIVTSGNTTLVEVPVAVTKLSILNGSGPVKPGTGIEESLKPGNGVPEVKITNTGCSSAENPLNSTGLQYVHTQKETLPASTKGGQLEIPFQPTGKFKLCLVYPGHNKTYSINYENKTATPGEPKIYLSQRPTAQVSADRVAKKSEYEAREPYKARSNAQTEATADKTKANGYETAYKKYEAEYKTAETNYKKYETEYKTAETEYKSLETKYKAEQANATTLKGKYTTEKTNWEVKKVEPYKKNYLKYEAEYKAAETAPQTTKRNTKPKKPTTTPSKANTKPKRPTTTPSKANTKPKKQLQHRTRPNTKPRNRNTPSTPNTNKDVTEYNELVAEEKEITESGQTVQSREEC